MAEFFINILNMSISASWIVLAVLLLRLLLKKAPGWIKVVLWGVVGVRLICPFSFESVFSLIPSAQTIDPEVSVNAPAINSGVPMIDHMVNPIIGETTISFQPEKDLNLFQFIMPYLAGVWLFGVALLLIYTAISYTRIKKKIGTAVLLDENIFQSERVDSPFVLGLIKPKIYLPFQINEQDMEQVIAHERAHISRKDHWWKPLGFLILALHWFNPLMWLGYALLCRDIELACDEKVIKDLDAKQKADYSQALLNCSVSRSAIAACPLAFGEVGVKNRVRSVLNYKKPAFWVIIVAILASVAVAVCFLTNPRTTLNDELSVFIDMQVAEHNYSPSHTDGNFIVTSHKILDVDETLNQTTVYMWSMYHEYSAEDGTLQLEAGSHIPTVITAKRTGKHGHYELVEYWTPRDGAEYAKDIRNKFPWYLRGKALNSQRYADEQAAFCRKSAEEYFRIEGENEKFDMSLPQYEGDQTILEPPALIVVSNEQSISALKGTSSWRREGDNGMAEVVMSDSSHPLVLKDSMPHIDILPAYATLGDPLGARLQFNAKGITPFLEVPPDEIRISCWGEKDWGKTDAVSENIVLNVVNGNLFVTLKDGNYIYEVEAVWSSHDKFGGTARYMFYTVKPDLVSHPKKIEELYQQTAPEMINKAYENGEFVITKEHCRTEDGIWMAGGLEYQYRLEISGRMNNAVKDTTYIVLSNRKDITFDETWKASGLSSLTTDYFKPADAVIVGHK